MKKILFYVFSILLGFSSCSTDDSPELSPETGLAPRELSYNFDPSKTETETVCLIKRSSKTLSANDAVLVSKQFTKSKGWMTRYMVSREIEKVDVLNLSDGNPGLYIINYKDDNGYVIVSASKNYTPILAYSDSGSFSLAEGQIDKNVFLKSYLNDIEKVYYSDADSLRMKYAARWSEYEDYSDMNATRSIHLTPQQIQALKNNAINQYTNQGYICYNMEAAVPIMSSYSSDTNRAQNILNDVCSHTNPRYDCMDVDLFLLKRFDYSYGPLCQTQWKQYDLYSNTLVGCAPLAFAQVAKYYQWPSSFSWNMMPNIIYSSNSYFYDLIEAIFDVMHPIYRLDGTWVSDRNFKSGVQQLGYSYSILPSTDLQDIGNYLQNGNPLILWGSGHAWICDGFSHHYREYSFMILDELGDYTFHQEVIDQNEIFWHANMCKSYYEAGWYYVTDTLNYTIETIYNLTPNN